MDYNVRTNKHLPRFLDQDLSSEIYFDHEQEPVDYGHHLEGFQCDRKQVHQHPLVLAHHLQESGEEMHDRQKATCVPSNT